MTKQRILGIDPGLVKMGWGIIELDNHKITHIANNVIKPPIKTSLAQRLVYLAQNLDEIIETYQPHKAAIEKTFVNKDGVATLKLGQARGIALYCPAVKNIPVYEYAPNTVKKAVVGKGHADKLQVQHMLKMMLPKVELHNADSADALAIAITAAYYSGDIPE